MGQILRTNCITGEEEWVEFEAGREEIPSGWDNPKCYSTAWTRPHVSMGAACHSEDVQSFNEDLKRAGITGAYHRPDGALVSSDRNAFNQVLKLRGMFNRDASYGDYAGNH